MSLTKAVAPVLRCNGCRTAIVRSFTSLSGFNANSIPSAPTRQQIRSQRTFTTFPRCLSQKEENRLPEEDELVEGVNSSPPQSKTEPASQETSIPWYLQQKPPTFASAQPIQQQDLPDLPPCSPPILKDLLEHISTNLGLDDLTLLDLRHLDPPPALGSHLIMLIGTARSEKHLHVSADRFCRWLRSTYKLRPHAAGLLGRNELKLKLRRKAKRMKMMANAGGGLDDGKELDDGIRTGWICCTVGRVEAHPEDNLGPAPEEQEGFVGFGKRTNGVNIVVQMFTEEKRYETDLETLWGGVVRTAKREGRIANEEEVVDQEAEVIEEAGSPKAELQKESAPAAPRTQHWPERVPSDVFPPSPVSGSAQQLR